MRITTAIAAAVTLGIPAAQAYHTLEVHSQYFETEPSCEAAGRLSCARFADESPDEIWSCSSRGSFELKAKCGGYHCCKESESTAYCGC